MHFSTEQHWQHERAKLLKRLCRHIAAGVDNGKTVQQLCRRYSRRWNGRNYKAQPARQIRLSSHRLRSIYYTAKANPAADAFALRYKPSTKAKVPAEFIVYIASLSESRKIVTLQAAIRATEKRWQAGLSVPGLGTWRSWAKANGVSQPPRLPFRNSVRRHLSAAEFRCRKALVTTIKQASAELAALDRAIAMRVRQMQSEVAQ